MFADPMRDAGCLGCDRKALKPMLNEKENKHLSNAKRSTAKITKTSGYHGT